MIQVPRLICSFIIVTNQVYTILVMDKLKKMAKTFRVRGWNEAKIISFIHSILGNLGPIPQLINVVFERVLVVFDVGDKIVFEVEKVVEFDEGGFFAELGVLFVDKPNILQILPPQLNLMLIQNYQLSHGFTQHS